MAELPKFYHKVKDVAILRFVLDKCVCIHTDHK